MLSTATAECNYCSVKWKPSILAVAPMRRELLLLHTYMHLRKKIRSNNLMGLRT